MKTENRKLFPYEKVFVGLKIFMTVVALAFMIVYAIYTYRWALCATWMCICVAQIFNSCVRWDEQRKTNILGLCAFGIMFVIFGFLLVRSL